MRQTILTHCGGRVEREYGLGRMRTDLLVIWPYQAGVQSKSTAQSKSAVQNKPAVKNKPAVQKVVIELKVLHKSLDDTIAQGLKQASEYMDRCNTNQGHLVIFDRSEGNLEPLPQKRPDPLHSIFMYIFHVHH
jgi:hypothetical protein